MLNKVIVLMILSFFSIPMYSEPSGRFYAGPQDISLYLTVEHEGNSITARIECRNMAGEDILLPRWMFSPASLSSGLLNSDIFFIVDRNGTEIEYTGNQAKRLWPEARNSCVLLERNGIMNFIIHDIQKSYHLENCEEITIRYRFLNTESNSVTVKLID